MLSVALNQRIEESALPAGEKLAARCAIAALDLLKSVAKAFKLTLDEVGPEHIADWCVAGDGVDDAQDQFGQPFVVRLPASIDVAWVNAVGRDADFFGQYAATTFMLREGFAKPADCSALPFKIWGADGRASYQLAPDADAAADMARAEGVEAAKVEQEWL
jgi:hypothetical protein